MHSYRSSRLICICAFVLLLLPAASPAHAPQGSLPESGAPTFTSLPAAVQGAISATLGEDDPAYHFFLNPPASAGENAWRLTNARHGFGADLGAEGALINTNNSRLNLRLTAYGYGESLQLVGKASLQASANRFEYVRDEIIEWYVNSPFGLEHGFTVSKPSRLLGSSAASLLTLTMALEGNLIPSVDEDENGLVFTNSSGEVVLRYSGLTAFDSDGKELPAWIELLPSGRIGDSAKAVAIRVETRGASYPITVDPWIQSAKLTTSDGAKDDGLGWAVAISGDVVVVGAPFKNEEAGAAYVFVKPSNGWTSMVETAVLTASDLEAGDNFGVSVAIDGDTIVVGAYGGDSSKGSAYVFVQPAAGWMDMTENGKLSVSSGAADDDFGNSVAVSGDTVVIGAYGVDGETGAAYVYVEPAAGWRDLTMYSAELTASNAEVGDHFGERVAISGDVIVVGAPLKNNDTGAVYVFEKPQGGWIDMFETANLTAPVKEHEVFGASFSISDNVIVVSAPQAESHKGAAYVFIEPADGWEDKAADAKLTASYRRSDDFFGISIAMSEDTIIVGSLEDRPDLAEKSVYVFNKPNSGWKDMTENAVLTIDLAECVAFGWTVAMNGSVIAIGAHIDDQSTGSVYLYESRGGKIYLPIIVR